MMNFKTFNSLYELMEAFPTEQSCIDYLEQLRWKDGVISPFDSTSKVYKISNNRYRCKNTGNNFNVKAKTMFSGSRVSLRKWYAAIWLVLSNKKGISSCQLARDIKVTQTTAWYMLQRIRNTLIFKNQGKVKGEVELDETFVGGKNKNRHWDKKVKNSQGRSFKDKTPVLGMLQRDGNVICRVVRVHQ
ncbi:MAG: IS1595 family transposase, partial [Prevotella sp.]|nr:IS1595 family transposase [Prevotella sp.]